MKQDLQALGEIFKELVGIFRKAVTRLEDDYSDVRMQQLKQDYEKAKGPADKLITDNNEALGLGKGTGEEIESSGDIEILDAEGTVLPQLPKEITDYYTAADNLQAGIIVRILAAGNDTEANEPVVHQLKVNGQAFRDFMSQQQKEKKEENDSVQQVKTAILEWIKTVIEKL